MLLNWIKKTFEKLLNQLKKLSLRSLIIIIVLIILNIILVFFIIKNYDIIFIFLKVILAFFNLIIICLKNYFISIYKKIKYTISFHLNLIYYEILINIFGFRSLESIKEFEKKYFSMDFLKYILFNFSLFLYIFIFIYLLSLTIWTRAAGPRTRVDQLIAFTFKNIVPCIIIILIIIILCQ